jgi:hypothetical protein
VRVLQTDEHRAVRAHHLVLVVVAQVPVRVGEHRLNLRPVHVQLLGDHHRDRGQRPLTHLGMRHADRDDAVLVDREPRVDLDAVGRRRPRLRLDVGCESTWNVKAQQQTAARGERCADERPA